MNDETYNLSNLEYHNRSSDDRQSVPADTDVTSRIDEHTPNGNSSCAQLPAVAGSTTIGFGGDVTVTLEVLEGRITDCKITGGDETMETGGRAIKIMQARIVEGGTVKVDAVCGATATSKAVLRAAAKAYNEAAGVKAGDVLMIPGKYTAEAMGYWGIWNLPVTITVNERALLKIETPASRFAHGETEVILQSVKDKLFPRMIENQSVNVDAIAGATVSSNAVKLAVESALKKALAEGGSEESAIEHFYNAPEKTSAGETEILDVDLLIVGMSTGGILAMQSAMETMRSLNGGGRISILAIDKAGKYGGKSALTHEAMAVNPVQYKMEKNNGEDFVDSEALLKDWLEYTTNDGVQSAKEDLIRLFMEESGKTIDWMHNLGWQFGSMKRSDMADGYVKFNTAIASGVDIGTYEDRRGIMDLYYKQFISCVMAQGGTYMLETEGYELIMDADTVKGVKARNNVTGMEYIINAKAVIMSTGGYGGNDRIMTEMIDKRWAGAYKQIGTGMDDGKMIEAALRAGAGVWNFDMAPIAMQLSLPHHIMRYPIIVREGALLDSWTGRRCTYTLNDVPFGLGGSADTIYINREGLRYCDESEGMQFATKPGMESWCASKSGPYYYAVYSKDQLDAIAIGGLNNVTRWEGYCSKGGIPKNTPLPMIYECLDICIEEGMAWKGDSLHELAMQLGIDPDTLINTVNEYNDICAAGVDDRFGKPAEYLVGIGSGPYYAVKTMNAIFASAGGLDVDTQIRVLKADHKTPINGLYAIGNDSLGVLLNHEKNYVGYGGVAQGWLVTAGRLAGVNASRYIHENYGLAEVTPVLAELGAHSV